jgi:nucleoside-diphosphate-sugar epimerase
LITAKGLSDIEINGRSIDQRLAVRRERVVRVAVTGAYGFSGKYMAPRLLALRHEVITLTNAPNRSNPFGDYVKATLISHVIQWR